MAPADYHIHTSMCRHARGTMAQYVEAALEQGFPHMGFSDHAPTWDQFDPRHRMDMDQFEHYVSSIEALRTEYPGIRIFTGIEADIYQGFEESLSRLLTRFPVDYVIGSVHYAGGYFVFSKDIEPMDTHQQRAIIDRYFSLMQQGLSTGLIDIAGHIDVIKGNFMHDAAYIAQQAADVLQKVSCKTHIKIEYNTSGVRKKPGQAFPSPAVLEAACKLNIPVVTGSDAHSPEQVGMDFSQAHEDLLQAGFVLHRGGDDEMFCYGCGEEQSKIGVL